MSLNADKLLARIEDLFALLQEHQQFIESIDTESLGDDDRLELEKSLKVLSIAAFPLLDIQKKLCSPDVITSEESTEMLEVLGSFDQFELNLELFLRELQAKASKRMPRLVSLKS